MRVFDLLATLGVALAIAVPACAEASCTDLFKFDPATRLTVRDIARAQDAGSLKVGDQNALLVWAFDPSARPSHAGWTALAVVVGSEGGLGAARPGGVLWTRKPGLFGPKVGELAAGGDAGTWTARTTGPVSCTFVVRLTADGTVTAGGRRLGSTLDWARAQP